MNETDHAGWRNWGRAWGILMLAALFGIGGFFLIKRSIADYKFLIGSPNDYAPAMVGTIYLILGVIGVAKGEFIFRRKVLARAMTRAHSAIGETGWKGDVPLAPFCMLSMYRPWKKAHAISSWVLIPLMVGLALLFRFVFPSIVGEATGALLRGPVYFAVGLALLYAAAIYLVALGRLVSWWASDGQETSIPLPARSV